MKQSQSMELPFDFSVFGGKMEAYPASARKVGDDWVFMARDTEQDWLFASGKAGRSYEGTARNDAAPGWVQAPLSSVNAAVLRDMFPFTAPIPVLKNNRTIGLGDRLGIATMGHTMALEPYDAVPVLAQQSFRELNLTGRTFSDVLDAACFGVFRAGFTRGFGADGDHLKTADEVKQALSLGYTMITLDCSEHIRGDADKMSDADVAQACELPQEVMEYYMDKNFNLGDVTVFMTIEQLQRNYLKYSKAIGFACEIYKTLIADYKGQVDFEISLDETDTPTLPDQHFFVVSELTRRGVVFQTTAPRFCGEFQKGVDYIGNPGDFEADLKQHAAIARHFGYKLSIHSGSDKFSIFGVIGRETVGRFHIKTAGTSWLTAMQLVAEKAPELYREIHRFALRSFEQARKYYHVTTEISRIPDISALPDDGLDSLFLNNDARQLIHITYGLILSKQQADGSYLYRDTLRTLWRRYAGTYAEMLTEHIGRHLALLYGRIS